jgi:hypothetical protein
MAAPGPGVVVLLLALALVGSSGCGKKGDPLPPLRPTPQPVTGLSLSQKGDRLEIALVAPRAGTDGSRLGVLELEILRADGEGDFTKLAKKRVVKAAPGEVITEDEALPPPGTLVRLAARAVVKGRPSVEAPPISLTVRAPLRAPTGLAASLTPKGVELRWSGETTESGGFRAYRRPASGSFGAPLTPAPVPGPPYLDADAPTGQNVCYALRSVASTDPPIESVASVEACIDVRDVAAPAPPTGLAVLVEEGAVALSWSPSMDRDLAHYRVYRSSNRGVAERLAELPAAETAFRDPGPAPGSALRYTITAVDAAGNESEPSAPAAAQIP